MSRNVQGHAIYQIIVLLVFLFAGPQLLIDHGFESQCVAYGASGDCELGRLNPFYTKTEYYDPALWAEFLSEDSSGLEDGLGTLKSGYKFDPQTLYTWQCNMFGQAKREYAETLHHMELCYMDYEELATKSYAGSAEQEILDEFRGSAWLQVLPSTEKLEYKGVDYTSRGMMTEQTKLFSLVFNAFVFMQIFN